MYSKDYKIDIQDRQVPTAGINFWFLDFGKLSR